MATTIDAFAKRDLRISAVLCTSNIRTQITLTWWERQSIVVGMLISPQRGYELCIETNVREYCPMCRSG